MRLIVGLGNPGPRYRDTRHNVGFRVIDRLAERWEIAVGGRRHQAEVGGGSVAGERVVLAKPQTYMNLSGEAVVRLRRAFGVAAPDVVAVYDDLDLPVGRVRVRADGGAGGHKGVASLIAVIGRGFPRVRVGVGRPPAGVDPVTYVLEPFASAERPVMATAIEHAVEAVECLLREGVERAMNTFNRRREDSGREES